MPTDTEFISEISAATIFTSFNFHFFRFSSFRFSGKGEADEYRICMCLRFIVSIVLLIVCLFIYLFFLEVGDPR